MFHIALTYSTFSKTIQALRTMSSGRVCAVYLMHADWDRLLRWLKIARNSQSGQGVSENVCRMRQNHNSIMIRKGNDDDEQKVDDDDDDDKQKCIYIELFTRS